MIADVFDFAPGLGPGFIELTDLGIDNFEVFLHRFGVFKSETQAGIGNHRYIFIFDAVKRGALLQFERHGDFFIGTRLV